MSAEQDEAAVDVMAVGWLRGSRSGEVRTVGDRIEQTAEFDHIERSL